MADLINMRSSGSRTCMPQRHAAAAPAVPVRPRRAAVQAKCILTPNQPDVGGRRELERRSALALSCTERSPVSAAEHLLGGGAYSQASFSSPRRIRVAVDVDEVLGRFVYALNKFCKEEYGMEYDVSDYWVYEFAKIWHCSQDQSNHIVHKFFESDHFNDGIPIIPGAFETLGRMQAHCDLVVVTSRQHVIQDLTLEWLDRHYAGLFSEVYFGNHFALQGASRKKSDICKTIDAHVLIDDNVGYAMDCADAGINVLLYDWEESYPWSKLPEGFSHPRIQVVRNWQEVEAAVSAMAAVEAVPQ